MRFFLHALPEGLPDNPEPGTTIMTDHAGEKKVSAVRGLVSNETGDVGHAEFELSPVGETFVRIRTEYSYLSAGTELRGILHRRSGGGAGGEARTRMGYSLSGIVVATGGNVPHVRSGDRVVAVGEGAFHAEEVVVAKNLVVPLPGNVGMRTGAVSAMLCFALEGLRKASPEFGENVLVLGAGMMGQVVARLASASGCRVFVMEGNAFRAERLPEAVKVVFPTEEGWRALKEQSAPYGVEKTFFCFGGDATVAFENLKAVMSRSPDGILQGKVVFSGGAILTTQMASANGNLQLLSSAKAGPGYRDPVYEAGGDYPAGYVKWDVRRNLRVLLDAVAAGGLEVDSLITHEYHFDEAAAAYEMLLKPNPDALAVVFRYGAEGVE